MEQSFMIKSEKGITPLELLGMLENSESKIKWEVKELEKYPKAKYDEVMCCPECGYCKSGEGDGMPDRNGFEFKTDDEGIEYVKCPCGCKFVEE